ncbi:testis-expressed protein 47 [Paramisgurnus dabryanus]|uniref:testis-expressed protein 47 n=1 Tax=Paramisgurnus dabryanus TaxID=90735 RepID=UPI0031F47944
MASRSVDSSEFNSLLLDDRVSLFTRRLMENHTSVRKKFLLHRLYVVGCLPSGLTDRRTVVAHYERFIFSQQRLRPGEGLTGLLLIYPEHALHIIECSTEVLLSVIQDLAHSAVILKSRVVLVSHDISSRLFQQWSFTLFKEFDSRVTINSEEQNSEELLIQTLHQLLQLASHLLNTGDDITECKEISEEVLKESQLIPPLSAVRHLIQMEVLLSPVQYLNIYHSPLHHQLDSGHVFGSLQPNTV